MSREPAQAGYTFMISGSVLLAVGILAPILTYILELLNCDSGNDLCGLLSVYVATLVGIPCVILGIILLVVGYLRKHRQ